MRNQFSRHCLVLAAAAAFALPIAHVAAQDRDNNRADRDNKTQAERARQEDKQDKQDKRENQQDRRENQQDRQEARRDEKRKERRAEDTEAYKAIGTLLDRLLSPEGTTGVAKLIAEEDRRRVQGELNQPRESYTDAVNQFRTRWNEKYGDNFNASNHLGILRADRIERSENNGKKQAVVHFEAEAGKPAFDLRLVQDTGGDYHVDLPDRTNGTDVVSRLETNLKATFQDGEAWPKEQSTAYSQSAHRLLYALRYTEGDNDQQTASAAGARNNDRDRDASGNAADNTERQAVSRKDADIYDTVATLVDGLVSTEGMRAVPKLLTEHDGNRLKDDLRDGRESYTELVTQFRNNWREKYGKDFNAKNHTGIIQANDIKRTEVEGRKAAIVHFDAQGDKPAFDLRLLADKESGQFRVDVPQGVDSNALLGRLEGNLKEVFDGMDRWPKEQSTAYRQAIHNLLYGLRTDDVNKIQ